MVEPADLHQGNKGHKDGEIKPAELNAEATKDRVLNRSSALIFQRVVVLVGKCVLRLIGEARTLCVSCPDSIVTIQMPKVERDLRARFLQ